MPLPTSIFGGALIVPVRAVPQNKDAFYNDSRAQVACSVALLMKQTFTAPSTIVTNGIVTSHAGAASAGTTTKTPNGSLASGGVATLTPARNVVITVTHASSVVAMSGTITGTRHGRTLTEAWSVTATGTTKTFTGAKAFDTVTSITEVIAADASTNTIIMGNGKVLGLNFVCSAATVLGEEQDGSVPGTPGVIVKGSSVSTADPRGTYTPNATLNGAINFVIRYISDQPSLF